MNSPAATSGASVKCGCNSPQALVDQRPTYANRKVFSRKNKVYRPDKRRKKTRFI